MVDSRNTTEEFFDRRFRNQATAGHTIAEGNPGRRDAQVIRALGEYGVRGRHCLDIGPGTGRWLQYLQELGAATLAAVDISRQSLDRVACLGADCQKADLEREPLKFEDGSMDITLAFMILEHLKDPGLFIDEVLRVTRREGLILMTIPNITSFQSRIRLALGMAPVAVAQDPTHVSFYTSRMLRELFRSHDAEVEIIPTGFSLHPRNRRKLQIPTNRLLSGLDDNRLFRVHRP